MMSRSEISLRPKKTSSSTIRLNRSPPPNSMAMEILQTKSPHAIEFPTTTPYEVATGEELLHPSHSQHPLVEVTVQDRFTCNGCKEYGSGKRFCCQQCDFQLHDFCALAPPALKSHPLHAQHQLTFHLKPKPGGVFWPRCDVCEKPTKGFIFRCSACHFQMHPCCAKLLDELNLSIHPHSLKILPPFPAGADSDVACRECKRQRSGRMYRCTVCEYHLHAVCAKNVINGLQAGGISSSGKPSIIGPTGRLATQIVIKFIGGLIQGVGETVGQVLIQDIVRGRCNSSRRRTTFD